MNTSKRCAGPLSESLCCPVCSAEPGNWSELQQHLTEHLCDVFQEWTSRCQHGVAGAGLSGSAPGSGRGRQRARRYSTQGRRANHSVAGQRSRAEGADRHRLQNLPGPLKAAGAIKNKPEAERAEAHEQLGPPYLHVWVAFLCNLVATKGLAAEHVSTVKTCWESHMVKSALASRVRHCRVKPCQKIEGKEGWMRSVFCLDTVTLPLEEALDAALRLQKGVRNYDPAPRGPARARSIEGTDRDAGEIERLARRLEPHTHRMAELVRSGVLEPSLACAFLMKNGGQQVNQGQGSETLPGADE